MFESVSAVFDDLLSTWHLAPVAGLAMTVADTTVFVSTTEEEQEGAMSGVSFDLRRLKGGSFADCEVTAS